LYLFFSSGKHQNIFRAVQLSQDGLGLSTNETKDIVIPNQSKKDKVFSSFHLKRGTLDYLFFTYQSSRRSSGLDVARSKNGPFGPYEIRNGSDPFIANNFYVDPSIVQDTNGDDVLVFGILGYFRPDSVQAASLDWESDWPVVLDYTPRQLEETDEKFVKNRFIYDVGDSQ